MSSLHDPFDLLKTEKNPKGNMDNVVPFLAQGKINQMIDHALTHEQIPAQKQTVFLSHKTWFTSGIKIGAGIAACIILLLTILPSQQQPISTQTQQAPAQLASASVTASPNNPEDVEEFSQLVMLDTWERY